MRRFFIPCALALIVVMAAGTAFAQQKNPKRAKAIKRIEMLRVWRLTQILELSQEDSLKLFPILQKYDAKFAEKSELKDGAMQMMLKELKSPEPDSQRVNEFIQQILAAESDAIQIRQQLYEELGDILSPEQVAKYMIFEINFQREINEVFTKVRGKRHRKKVERKYEDLFKKTPVPE